MDKELFISDFKQMVRFYPKHELAAAVARYVDENYFAKQTSGKEMKITYETVLNLCCAYFNTTLAEMKAISRQEIIRLKRQQTIYLLRKYTRLSCETIGTLFDRDHTTILHNCRRIKDLIDTDHGIRRDIVILSGLIKGEPITEEDVPDENDHIEEVKPFVRPPADYSNNSKTSIE